MDTKSYWVMVKDSEIGIKDCIKQFSTFIEVRDMAEYLNEVEGIGWLSYLVREVHNDMR